MVVDLSEYHPALRAGANGYAEVPTGTWAPLSDHFVRAWFDGVAFDILAHDLEVVDPELRSALDARRRAILAAIASGGVQEVRFTRSPRGSFQKLHLYFRPDAGLYPAAWTAREECEDILKELERVGAVDLKPPAQKRRGASLR